MPCAGTGSRMGLSRPKQFELLAGQPMALHAIQTFLSMPEIQSVWVGISQDAQEQSAISNQWPQDARFRFSSTGGATRAQTVCNTLKAMAAAGVDEDDWILVHDAARPGLTKMIYREIPRSASSASERLRSSKNWRPRTSITTAMESAERSVISKTERRSDGGRLSITYQPLS